MEGTDADCVNGKAIENDTTTYDVTVKLAGVATSKKCFYFRNPAYTTDGRGNFSGKFSSTKFFRAIELWRFCVIMILEDSGDDQLSR